MSALFPWKSSNHGKILARNLPGGIVAGAHTVAASVFCLPGNPAIGRKARF
ncbi:MAG: hypothetical protein ACYC2W_10410 [Desulfurivibrionaceae bacterium]